MNEITEPCPTTSVNGSPEVMGELLELDPIIADEIMYLVAGVEQYKNLRIPKQKLFELSLESQETGSQISHLIDFLIRFIKRVLRDVNEGGFALGFSLGKLVNRAETINTTLRTKRRLNRTTTFTLTTRVANLCVNYKPINDPQQLLMFLKSTDYTFRNYFKYQNVELPSIIPFLATLIPEDPESVFKLTELLGPVSPMNKGLALGLNSTQTGFASPNFLGNQRLHIIDKSPNGDAVEKLVGQEFLILPSSDNPRPIPDSITYTVFASTIEQSLLRQIITTGNDLENNFGLVSRNRRASRLDDLAKYLENTRNRITRGQFDAETQERANQIVRLLETYSTWLANPYLNMMALYIRNMTAILNVCEANN